MADDAQDQPEDTTSTEGISTSDLADQDFGTALSIGAMPLVLFGLMFLMGVGFYFIRKKNAWRPDETNENGGESAENAKSNIEFPTTEELSKMDETEPAKKL